MDLNARLSQVRTRQDLVEFIRALNTNLLENGDNWENPTLERYLDAMAAWIADMDGFYKNQGVKVPKANWQLMGQILLAATIYE
jgi:hypothetical protein